MHVGDVAERCQMGKVPHEELQRPGKEIYYLSTGDQLSIFTANLKVSEF